MGSPKLARTADSASLAVEPRIELASQFISAGMRVLELDGSSLKPRLPFGCIYRSARLDALPGLSVAKYDMIVMLGALQTLDQAEAFFRTLARAERTLLIAFRPDDDNSSLSVEDGLGFYELIRLIDNSGFRIEASASLEDGETVMRLTPARKITPLAPCSVAVLGGGMTFAERLGGQMINALLPGEADVHHINFGELGAARDRYDLVVLGAGQGLFHPLFADDVFDVVKRGSRVIGVFGAQQRDLLPRAAFDRLIDRLDVWFARSHDDMRLYGRGRNNITYLGDWLIEQFPFGQARATELLTIGEESLADLPLDRAIAAIQRHRTVFARAAAPLLCALTTADSVAYADDVDAPSGEFRGLLGDIFGRHYPENEFFQVDRDAVMRYRVRVHRNVGLMRARIDALLRGNAATAA